MSGRPWDAALLPRPRMNLQRRVDGNRWQTVGRGRLSRRRRVLGRRAADRGGVLRARQEPWTQGDDAIGWFPSFPTYFRVGLLPFPRDAGALGRARTPRR